MGNLGYTIYIYIDICDDGNHDNININAKAMKIMISTMLHLISSSLHHYDDCDNLIVWFFMTMISIMVIVLTKMMIFPPFSATLTLAPHRGIVVNRISDAAKYIVLHIPVHPPPPWAPFNASTDFYEMWFTILQKKQNNLKRQLFIMQIPILVRWRLLCQNGLRISVFHNGLEFGTFKKCNYWKAELKNSLSLFCEMRHLSPYPFASFHHEIKTYCICCDWWVWTKRHSNQRHSTVYEKAAL